ncbi:hypothetical protein BDW72DRAFT_15094 [Aspergillus terricola var. indicus]
MTTCRVSNRYIARADLVSLLERLFPGQYSISEHSDAWVISGISRALTEVCVWPLSFYSPNEERLTTSFYLTERNRVNF